MHKLSSSVSSACMRIQIQGSPTKVSAHSCVSIRGHTDISPRDEQYGAIIPETPHYTMSLREGPYTHLNLAGVQSAILQVADHEQPVSADSPESITSHASSSSSDFGSAPNSPPRESSSPWVPFKVALDENTGPQAMLDTLQDIFERRLSTANRMSRRDWTAEDAKAALVAQSRKHVDMPVAGPMEQFRYLPMAPTKMNKELLRIRKYHSARCIL